MRGGGPRVPQSLSDAFRCDTPRQLEFTEMALLDLA